MHPTRRHVPPSSRCCSIQTAFAPSCAARIAAVYPPGPPPRTATSHSIRSPSLRSLWSILVAELRLHRPRAGRLADLAEAEPLVQRQRRVLGLDAQTERVEAVFAGPPDQRFEELRAEPVA